MGHTSKPEKLCPACLHSSVALAQLEVTDNLPLEFPLHAGGREQPEHRQRPTEQQEEEGQGRQALSSRCEAALSAKSCGPPAPTVLLRGLTSS